MERPVLSNMSGRLRGLTRGWSRLGIRDHGRGIARILVPDYPSASSVALRSAGPSRSVTCGSPASPPPTWPGSPYSLGSPTTRRTGPRGTRAMRSGSTGRGYFSAPGDVVGQGSRVDSRAVGTGCERVLDGGGAPARSAVQDGPRGGTASEERRRARESLMRFNQSSDGRLARSGGPSGSSRGDSQFMPLSPLGPAVRLGRARSTYGNRGGMLGLMSGPRCDRLSSLAALRAQRPDWSSILERFNVHHVFCGLSARSWSQ